MRHGVICAESRGSTDKVHVLCHHVHKLWIRLPGFLLINDLLVQLYDSNHQEYCNPSIKLLRHHGLEPDVSEYLFAFLFFLNVAVVLSLEAFVMSQGKCSLRIHPSQFL